MITSDFHTHTRASDGTAKIEDNFNAAKERGIKELAITDHGFVNIVFHMTKKKYDSQQKEIDKLNKTGEVKILHGIEANILADGTLDIPNDFFAELDILNVGYHRLLQPKAWRNSFLYIFGNGWLCKPLRKKLIKKNTAAFISVLQNYPVDTLCHLNNRALVDTAAVCRAACDKKIYIELNEKHIESLEEDIDIILASGAEFILGSDAHKKTKVGNFPKVEEFIKKHNIPLSRICGINGKKPVLKNKKSI